MTGPRSLVRTRASGDLYVLETVAEIMVLWEASAPFVELTTHAGPLFVREDEIVLVDTVVISVNQDGES